MKSVYLLDDSLQVEISFVAEDSDLEDNICVKIDESCVEEEKIFKHDETFIFLTQQQALQLIQALSTALEQSKKEST